MEENLKAADFISISKITKTLYKKLIEETKDL